MKHTAVDNLDIQGIENIGPNIFLSVHSVNDNISKYYFNFSSCYPVRDDDSEDSEDNETGSELNSRSSRNEVYKGAREVDKIFFQEFKKGFESR